MPPLRTALFLLLTATTAQAAGHDFYICAATNKNFVVGSVITTINGVFRHEDNNDWTHIGINDVSIEGLSFDPRDHNVAYTASINGAWRTRDGGKSWRFLTSWDMTEAKDVRVDPNSPDHVYLALPDGIAVSSDRGDTWPRKENGLPERGKFTQVIGIDRLQAGRVLIGCEAGIFLTEDGADSWRQVFKAQTTVYDLIQSPADPKRWLAITQRDGALLSHDNGLTWQKLPGVPSEHALYNGTFDATHPGRMAIASWTYGVLTSEDGGATWTSRNDGLPGIKAGFRMPSDPGAHSVWRVAVHPDTGRLYASVVGEALYSSDDFGRTWKSEGLEGSQVSRFVFLPRPTTPALAGGAK